MTIWSRLEYFQLLQKLQLWLLRVYTVKLPASAWQWAQIVLGFASENLNQKHQCLTQFYINNSLKISRTNLQIIDHYNYQRIKKQLENWYAFPEWIYSIYDLAAEMQIANSCKKDCGEPFSIQYPILLRPYVKTFSDQSSHQAIQSTFWENCPLRKMRGLPIIFLSLSQSYFFSEYLREKE